MLPSRPTSRRVACAALVLVAAGAASATAQLAPPAGAQEIQTVTAARAALEQFAGLQIESIPQTMLEKAEGIAIFPNMIKGGFILGVNFGRGVLMVRRPDRTWSPPVMVTMGGGSLGFQAGVQSADIVLVFATPQSLQGILTGQKVTLGADASVALGPVGRQANAGTDARLGAEIYSYARSRGLFAGVSLGGADLSVDQNANSMLYGRFGVTPSDVFEARGLAFHPEVKQLMEDLDARSRPATVPTPAPTPGPAQPRQAAVPAATVPIAPIGGQPAPTPVAQPAAAAPAPSSAPPLVPIR
ncbi:MAG: lipid-binding SYLF domain-containing protein [Planctomycetaceae bacterium]